MDQLAHSFTEQTEVLKQSTTRREERDEHERTEESKRWADEVQLRREELDIRKMEAITHQEVLSKVMESNAKTLHLLTQILMERK